MSSLATLVLGLFGSLLLAAPARGQQLQTEEQKRFYQEYKNRLTVSDLLGVNRQVASNVRVAELVFDILCERYSRNGSEEVLGELRPLATALDEKHQGTRFSKRIEYLKGLDGGTHNKRLEAISKMLEAMSQYDRARSTKEKSDYRLAAMALDEALTELQAVKDLEYVSWTRFRLAHCYDMLGEYGQAVKGYDVAMDEWLAAGRPKTTQDYSWMVERRRDLIDRGYTPEGDSPADHAGPAKNTSTSFVEGSAWEDWKTSFEEMRRADRFKTPSIYGSSYFALWKQFSYRPGDVTKLEYFGPCQPFGTPLQIVRDGAQGFLDLDGDGQGDVEAKVLSGKPTLTTIAEGRGKDARKYSLFLLTGLQNMPYLGHTVNFQELGYYKVGCYREGKVLGEKLVLIDDNCTGVIGDAREDRDGVLRTYPIYWDIDAVVVGRGAARPYSDVLEIDGKYYRIKLVDPHAETLRTRELNLETGTVTVDWDGPEPPVALVIREIRELEGAFFDVAGGEPVEVPVGRYEIACGRVESGRKTSVKQALLFKGKSRTFEVKAGENTVLEMGAPYRFEFETEDASDRFIVKGKSLLIYDRADALVGKVFPDLILPEVSIRNAESQSLMAKGEKTRLISTDTFNRDSAAVWFFDAFVFEKSPGTKCEAKLSLRKKHKLLGGPFESDWY